MKRDNASRDFKIRTRRRLVESVGPRVVLEACAGEGAMYRAIWRDMPWGSCADKVESKARAAAIERPGWVCYHGNAIAMLRSGWARHVGAEIVDLDVYGAPYDMLHALSAAMPDVPEVWVLATDGLQVQRNVPRVLLEPGETIHGWAVRDAYVERGRAKMAQWLGTRWEIVSWVTSYAPPIPGGPHAIAIGQHLLHIRRLHA